jgi:hypothetical protein
MSTNSGVIPEHWPRRELCYLEQRWGVVRDGAAVPGMPRPGTA